MDKNYVLMILRHIQILKIKHYKTTETESTGEGRGKSEELVGVCGRLK